MHLNDLDEETFYLYEVSGGDDWDVNDDGVMDAAPTPNKAKVRAIATGGDLKRVGHKFALTYVSELVYETVAKLLKYDFDRDNFDLELDLAADKIIKDIDSDEMITIKDVIQFDPALHNDRLSSKYLEQKDGMIDAIRLGKAPLQPYVSQIGKKAIPGGISYDIVLASDETKAFVAAGKAGLAVFNVNNPANPILFDIYDTGSDARGVALSSDGTKAFVANDNGGLMVLDVTDPTKITKIGSFDTGGTLFAGAVDVILSSDETKAYVADVINGLVILDIVDPSQITKIGSVDTGAYAHSVVLSSDGTKVYVANDYRGLTVFDVNDSANPRIIGSVYTGGEAVDVTLSHDGTKAYVVDKNEGLAIIDIRDLENLTKIGSYTALEEPESITLSSDGAKAFIADYENGLIVLNVSDSDKITMSEFYETDYNGDLDVALSHDGTKAFMVGVLDLAVIDLKLFE